MQNAELHKRNSALIGDVYTAEAQSQFVQRNLGIAKAGEREQKERSK